MGKTHHIIYIPGLGDQKPAIQIKLLNRWGKSGVKVHFFKLGWHDDEPFNSKLARLNKLIDDVYKENGPVSLVGVSAGGGAAVNAYVGQSQKISGVVYICGKIIGLKNVNESFFKKNPSFFDSLQLTQKNLGKLRSEDKAKMMSIRPIFDEIVPVGVTKIPGVKSRLIISALHVPSIFLCLTIYKSVTINFLKRQAGLK